jgi:hypothetical protein
MKTTPLKKVKIFVQNIVFVALVYLSAIQEIGWATNFLYAVTGFIFAITLFAAFRKGATQQMIRQLTEGKHLPSWLDNTFFALIILPLVYYGWLFTAALWIFVWFQDGVWRAMAKQRLDPLHSELETYLFAKSLLMFNGNIVNAEVLKMAQSYMAHFNKTFGERKFRQLGEVEQQ